MPGFPDLLYALSGAPNPQQQLAAYLSGQQQGLQQPPGPQPPSAPATAANANAQSGGTAPNPAPGNPGPGQPIAYASTPDQAAANQTLANPNNLMSIYMQMDARNRASDQINRGLALMASHWASPAAARNILESVGAQPDAGQQLGNLMQIYQMQYQQQAMQQMLGSAPDIAAKTGLPESIVRAEIMAGRGDELVQWAKPTEQQKNIQFIHDQYMASGGNEQDWKTNVLPTVMMGLTPGMTPDYMSYLKEAQNWPQTHPGQPVPDFVQWKNIVQQQQETLKEKSSQVTDAQAGMKNMLGPLTTMQTRVDNLQTAAQQGKLDALFQLSPAILRQIATSDNATTANNWLKSHGLDFGYALTEEQVNFAKDIYELSEGSSRQSMQALGATSPRQIAPQFATIGSFLPAVGDLSRGKTGWLKNLGDLRENILNGEANVYGAANVTPPDELKTRMNPIYGAGGEMNLRTPQPIPEAEIQQLVEMVKKDPTKRGDVIKFAKGGNYDTTELERRLNQ